MLSGGIQAWYPARYPRKYVFAAGGLGAVLCAFVRQVRARGRFDFPTDGGKAKIDMGMRARASEDFSRADHLPAD